MDQMDVVAVKKAGVTVIPKSRRRLNEVKRHKALYLLMVPGILYLILNNYLPMFGVAIAFQSYNYTGGFFASKWIGFKNFEYLFATSDALLITRNTLLYNATFIIVNLILSVAMALLLNEVTQKGAKRFYQSAILLPYFLSAVIVAYLLYSFLNPASGFINKSILEPLGIEPVMWYLETKYWPFILIMVNAWKSAGYGSIIYISAMAGFDVEYYEAATIDGAKKLQQIRYITIPLLKPVMIVMTILAIGRIFYSDFGLFYQLPMQSGALLPVTNVIDTYVYRGLITLGDIGMSSAAGFYQSIVGFLLVLITNFVIRRISPDNALF